MIDYKIWIISCSTFIKEEAVYDVKSPSFEEWWCKLLKSYVLMLLIRGKNLNLFLDSTIELHHLSHILWHLQCYFLEG